MIRSISRTATAALFMLTLFAACKKEAAMEDLTETNSDWVKRENKVLTAFQQVQKKQADLDVAFTTLPPADPADTVLGAERNKMQTLLQQQGARLGEIQTMIDAIASKRDSATAAGEQTAIDEFWKKAQSEYAAIETAIAELDATYGPLTTQLGKVSSLQTKPTADSGSIVDTSASAR